MKISLHLPGLLAAPRRLLGELAMPPVAALERWLTLATSREVPAGRHGAVADLLALQHAPMAALAWLGVHGDVSARPVFLATPVHLRAGMHDLVLFTGARLAVTDSERTKLARDAAAFFGDEPEITAADGEMFLRATDPVAVDTVPLYRAQGETVRENLPHGADAARVHAWMNELQMFLHAHPLNRERAARELPPLNGVWLWGEGELPRVSQKAIVYGTSAAMRGLGRWLGEARAPQSPHAMLPAQGHHVVEMRDCADALDADDSDAWRKAVARLDRELLKPVFDWVNANAGAEAVLYPGDGQALHLERRGPLARLARRVKPRTTPRISEE